MDSTAIIAILSVFGLAPMTVFGFILLLKRQKHRVEELRYKKEILELELEREAYKIKLLQEENRKYDRLIHGESENWELEKSRGDGNRPRPPGSGNLAIAQEKLSI